MANRTIVAPYFGFKVVLTEKPDGKVDGVLHGDFDFYSGDRAVAASTLEDFIVFAAVAGLDITTPEFCKAVELAYERVKFYEE